MWLTEHLEDLNLTTDFLSHVQAMCVYVCVCACMCACMCTCMYGWDREAAKEVPASQKFRAENGSDLNGPIVDHGQVRWPLGGTHDLVLLGQAILCI